MYKLTVELVPKTSWYNNVRAMVDEDEWDIIRHACYKRANWCCEICGAKGTHQGFRHNVECHEIWRYDDYNRRQILDGMIALCPRCHQVKHIGLSTKQGKYEEIKAHFMKVNGVSEREATEYFAKCWETWRKRSKYEWNIDTYNLEEYLQRL